ncbi:MAG TPA: hypothetical protein VG387_03200 [Rhizomicrobium sp.]|nr:hypothetical protein [Rhizomicrobium sp.]
MRPIRFGDEPVRAIFGVLILISALGVNLYAQKIKDVASGLTLLEIDVAQAMLIVVALALLFRWKPSA